MNLRIPGPTPVPAEVASAMSGPMVDHRGPETAALLGRIEPRLKAAFQTEQDVMLVTTSGTGGLEAAVVNTLSPGDRVLSASIGNFGERLASIATTYGADVVKLKFDNGQAADPAQVEAALKADPSIKAVLVTHNETSTGVTNPLEQIAAAVRPSGALLIVDAVSSLSSIPVKTDAWGLDVVVSGSQKGWMLPPGLAFVSMSERAWQANERATMPRFYFDLAKHRDSLRQGTTPWTPALSIIFALDVALDLLEAEGWEAIFARHQACADLTRSGVKRLGLTLLAADERYASNTVTAVVAPPGLDVSKLRKTLREQNGVVVGGGQADLSGKIFRIGHLGLVQEDDIRQTLDALAEALPVAGFEPAAARA